MRLAGHGDVHSGSIRQAGRDRGELDIVHVVDRPQQGRGPPRCHIDREVEENEEHGNDQDNALHLRIITLLNGLHEQAAQSGPVEDVLDQHRAAQQRSHLQSHHRHDRTDRVVQDVPRQHRGAR